MLRRSHLHVPWANARGDNWNICVYAVIKVLVTWRVVSSLQRDDDTGQTGLLSPQAPAPGIHWAKKNTHTHTHWDDIQLRSDRLGDSAGVQLHYYKLDSKLSCQMLSQMEPTAALTHGVTPCKRTKKSLIEQEPSAVEYCVFNNGNETWALPAHSSQRNRWRCRLCMCFHFI